MICNKSHNKQKTENWIFKVFKDFLNLKHFFTNFSALCRVSILVTLYGYASVHMLHVLVQSNLSSLAKLAYKQSEVFTCKIMPD